jgi:hypothetical protein
LSSASVITSAAMMPISRMLYRTCGLDQIVQAVASGVGNTGGDHGQHQGR